MEDEFGKPVMKLLVMRNTNKYNMVKCRAIERMVPQRNKMVAEEMKSAGY